MLASLIGLLIGGKLLHFRGLVISGIGLEIIGFLVEIIEEILDTTILFRVQGMHYLFSF